MTLGPGGPGVPIPAPSNRSPLVAFGYLKVSGGDLLEGAGIGSSTSSVGRADS